MLLKNTLKKIKKSFGRYFSILIIILVGSGFYAGIKATAPSINNVAINYYKNYNLYDLKLVSTLGLSEVTLESLKNVSDDLIITPSNTIDVIVADKVLRVHALLDSVNNVRLLDGRMPLADDECLADGLKYKLGDFIEITSDTNDVLTVRKYKVVGTIQSVLYLFSNYGTSSIGDGSLYSYIFIPKNNFLLDYYSEIYLNLKNKEEAYSGEYDSLIDEVIMKIEEIKSDIELVRYNEIYDKAYQEITNNEKILLKEKNLGLNKLNSAKKNLDSSLDKMNSGKKEIAANQELLNKQVKDMEIYFTDNKTLLNNGYKQIKDTLESLGLTENDIPNKLLEINNRILYLDEQMLYLNSESLEYLVLREEQEMLMKNVNSLCELQETIANLKIQEINLNHGQEEFDEEIKTAQEKLDKALIDVLNSEKPLNDGYREYNENLRIFNKKILEAEEKITDAKKKLNSLEKPTLHIFDRANVSGYVELEFNTDKVAIISNIIPIFFIIIIFLMTSNTMARMIVEERGEIGALTSLGYSNIKIVGTYLLYVLSASIIGVVSGYFIGLLIIPEIIYQCFPFIYPKLELVYDIKMLLMIMITVIGLMTAVTIFGCLKELRDVPAKLLRPVFPRSGKKIYLEKIKIIWSHLSFTWKVTVRNISRYKKRVLMMIIGISGGTALLLAGFGIKDSINGIGDKQYGEIFKYQDMFILKDEVSSLTEDQSSEFEDRGIVDPLLIKQSVFENIMNEKTDTIYIVVPYDNKLFEKYYNLVSKVSGNVARLTMNEVIITNKLANIFGVDIGDEITIKNDMEEYRFVVSDIVQNYLGNYLYISPNLYQEIIGGELKYNVVVSNYEGEASTISKSLTEENIAVSVKFADTLRDDANNFIDGLNGVVVLLVVVAALQAFIILYNLTSINISERNREIATLKVLGFTDYETNGYIYREMIVLTLLSIIVGLFLGFSLHRYLMFILEGNSIEFAKNIKWPSYIYASLITMIFSLIMQVVTYFKLQKIDMIESLKSVE